MKITFVTAPVDLSGGSRVISIYAKELAAMGHQVTIVSQPHPKPATINKLASIVKGKGWPKTNYPSHFDELNLDHIFLETYRPITPEDVPDADVIIATWWETAEWVATFPPEKGRKFYFIQHHEVFPYLPKRSRDSYRLPLRKIVVARWLEDLMASQYGDRDVALVPNTVDRSHFNAPPRHKNKTPTIGVMYATTPFKGFDIALAAINKVRAIIPDLNVMSFGSATLDQSFQLPPNSTFEYRPNQDRIRKIYSECDVWLTCSRSEGFNLPALEAMACRTPVVSTRTGWPAEGIIDRINGMLADIDDVEGVASGLLWLLQLPDAEWKLVSDAARQTKTTESWSESAGMFEKSLLRL